MQRLTHKSEKGEAEPKENTTTHEIRFAAFFKFMPTFLDKLTKSLVCSGNDKLNGNKKNLANKLIFFQEKKFILMTTWTTSRSLVKQNYTRKKSILLQAESDTRISDDDHEHAQKIWREFLNFLFIFENVETSVIIMIYI